ncbi:MAG: hypothetical protein KME23_00980 [Goleter apudmare HA4340-LM2]|nr:hypothetical protein [Goleter apudmare HA4340-LM2]
MTNWKCFGSISRFAVNFSDRLQSEPLQPIKPLFYNNTGRLIPHGS